MKKIAIKFPAHVQHWEVTPHGGDLTSTAPRDFRIVPETDIVPRVPQVDLLQPRAEERRVAP